MSNMNQRHIEFGDAHPELLDVHRSNNEQARAGEHIVEPDNVLNTQQLIGPTDPLTTGADVQTEAVQLMSDCGNA